MQVEAAVTAAALKRGYEPRLLPLHCRRRQLLRARTGNLVLAWQALSRCIAEFYMGVKMRASTRLSIFGEHGCAVRGVLL
jgi:hypothetical protein